MPVRVLCKRAPMRVLFVAARPHLLAVVFFGLAVVGYFHPVFLQDKELRQPDDEQDLMMNARVAQERAEQKSPVFWNPAVFSGMPTYVGLVWEAPVVAALRTLFRLRIQQPMGTLFTLLFCTYLMMLCFAVRPSLAVLGALFFAFSTYPIICFLAGHSERLSTLAPMPLLLGGLHLALRRGKIYLGGLLVAVGLSLQLHANHLQIVYYTLLLLLSYTLFCVCPALNRRRLLPFLRGMGCLMLAGLLGMATAWGSLSTLYEYAQHSIRGQPTLIAPHSGKNAGLDKDYAFAYSFRKLEPLTLLVPNFQGGTHAETLSDRSAVAQSLIARNVPHEERQTILAALPTYWGDQPISFPNYAGVTVVALFVLGLVLVERKLALWAVGLLLFSCMLAWGRNFSLLNDFLFDYMPFYNRFRSQGFVLCLPLLCFALVAAVGLEKAWSGGAWEQKFWPPLLGVLCVLVVIFLGSFFFSYRGVSDLMLLHAGYPSWFLSALRADRQSLLWHDLLRSATFFVALTAVLYASAYCRASLHLRVLLVGLVCMIDLLPINLRLLPYHGAFSQKTWEERHPPSPADEYILSRNQEEARVLYVPNPFNDNTPSYRHASAGGYHAAKLRRYNDLIRYGMDPALEGLREQRADYDFSAAEAYVFNMLNVGYFIFGRQKEDVVRNSSAFGRAWLAEQIHFVGSPEEEMNLLRTLQDKGSVVMDTTRYPLKKRLFATESNAVAEGTLVLVEDKANRMRYTAVLPRGGVAVFSEIDYPDWQARVNGKVHPILRVNYVLRALRLPPGTHEIIFSIAPRHYAQKKQITLGANLLLLLVLCAVLWRMFGGWLCRNRPVP